MGINQINIDFEVKHSGINGEGLFALRDFEIGEQIFDWAINSCVISEQEYISLTEEEKEFTQLTNGIYRQFLFPANKINHSCKPNTCQKDNGDYVISHISKGNEITTSYKNEDNFIEFVCNCEICSKG